MLKKTDLLILTTALMLAAGIAYAEDKPAISGTMPVLNTETKSAAKPATENTAKPEKTTLENLQAAYDGESNAKARYEAFATKAEQEGYLGIASLFKAAADAEGYHLAKHAKVIESLGAKPTADVKAPKVKSTKENLKTALTGENYERVTMYPEFIKKAKADKNAKAVMSFGAAASVEAVHAKLFAEALAKPAEWKAKRKFIVCQNCGFTSQDMKLKICPVCHWPRSKFDEVE